MRYTAESVARVLDGNNIVDLIGAHTELKPSSGGYMGRCPFPDHQEKTPSFSVSETKQVFHCFGCGKKGNKIGFLKQFHGLDFRAAVEFLSERASIPLEMESGFQPDNRVRDHRKELLRVNEHAKNFFKNCLREISPNHYLMEYLKKRGLSSPEVINLFELGFAPDGGTDLVKSLSRAGLSLELAAELKLIRPRSERSQEFYDGFRDRLMFPILSVSGEVLGFGGRVIRQGEPKYLNSPESQVFNKSRILYGAYWSNRFARSLDQVILVEGYMDFIALYNHGIQNALAPMGTSFTAEQAKQVARITKNVTVLFDGDRAGKAAMERSLPILLREGIRPRGLVLPEGLDPDDFLNQFGAEALKQKLESAQDLFDFVLIEWLKGYQGSAAETATVLQKVTETLKEVPDPILRRLFVETAGRKMGLSSQAQSQLVRNIAVGSSAKTPGAQEVKPLAKSAPEEVINLKIATAPHAEIVFVRTMLKSPELWRDGIVIELDSYMQSEGLKSFIEKGRELARQRPMSFASLKDLLLSDVDKPELLVDNSEAMVATNDGVIMRDCVRKIKDDFLKNRASEIQRQIRIQSTPELMKELMEIQKQRQRQSKQD